MLAKHYAKALYGAVQKNPAQGLSYLRNLREALRRRGHDTLFPHIFHEYKKLELAKTRAEASKHITPEAERTRILLELYNKLTRNG